MYFKSGRCLWNCDGVGPDCRETCPPDSPLSSNCTQDDYGWGPELS